MPTDALVAMADPSAQEGVKDIAGHAFVHCAVTLAVPAIVSMLAPAAEPVRAQPSSTCCVPRNEAASVVASPALQPMPLPDAGFISLLDS